MHPTAMNKTLAFEKLIQEHKGLLYKVTNAYCKNEEDRKDLIQEIIVQLWKSFDKYDPQFKHSTWIYRIALNVSISFYRKEKRRTGIANPLSESLLKYCDTFEKNAEQETNINLLHTFIAELKELDRALMILYLEEKSHKEIAEITGITETNVATRIGRIKIILKQKFSLIKN
jgi:RNA polymerase sigma factor (sigma-70 family)